ncbi:hypothetical protein B0H16DRAFT_1340553 [Mycena metata]|uniref:Cyanovirin-N domain-containing protein n=1 Tax=Mycena metata TaxID=1033252 RepID=A0AAD7H7R9_9AGAR|nr:hypothetical protein B0H16DRAFT_1340553 [Mycena metata]
MKVISIAFALSITAPALAATVKYCTGLSLAGPCFTSSPPDGVCSESRPIFFDVNVDLSVNDQTHSAEIQGGNCVFWANANCNGDHTDQLDGTIDVFNTICGGGWQKRISAFKCCPGEHLVRWKQANMHLISVGKRIHL